MIGETECNCNVGKFVSLKTRPLEAININKVLSG